MISICSECCLQFETDELDFAVCDECLVVKLKDAEEKGEWLWWK